MTIRQTSTRRGCRGRRAPGPRGRPARPVERRRRATAPPRPPTVDAAPGGVLMLVVIVIPLAGRASHLAARPRPVHVPASGCRPRSSACDNYVEALGRSRTCCTRSGSASSARLIATLVTLPIGVAAALATQNRFRGRALVRSVFLIPYVLPAFVVGTVWRIMLQPDGVANHLARIRFGIDGGLWLNGPKSYWTLILVQIWASWPLVYLLALSGLQSVDPEVHEAAALDGARWWTKLRYVVLPVPARPDRARRSSSRCCTTSTLHAAVRAVRRARPARRRGAAGADLRGRASRASGSGCQRRDGRRLADARSSIPLFVYLRAVRLDSGEEAPSTVTTAPPQATRDDVTRLLPRPAAPVAVTVVLLVVVLGPVLYMLLASVNSDLSVAGRRRSGRRELQPRQLRRDLVHRRPRPRAGQQPDRLPAPSRSRRAVGRRRDGLRAGAATRSAAG